MCRWLLAPPQIRSRRFATGTPPASSPPGQPRYPDCRVPAAGGHADEAGLADGIDSRTFLTPWDLVYVGGLGLRELGRLTPRWAELAGARIPIYLLLRPEPGFTAGSATLRRDFGRHRTPVHLDFVVDDLQAAVERVVAAGGALDRDMSLASAPEGSTNGGSGAAWLSSAGRSDITPFVAQASLGSAHRVAPLLAWVAAGLGVLYASASAYWAVGGTGLLDTIGGALERDARAGGVVVEVGLWAVVILKLIAVAVPIQAARDHRAPGRRRMLRRVAGLEAASITSYGLVLKSVGLLVQADVIASSHRADQRALAWHAFLWDPWFLVWRLLVIGALVLSRSQP